MVYQIYLAGYGYIYDSSEIVSSRLDISTGQLMLQAAIDPRLTLEINDPGALEFKLYPDHPAYNKIKLFDSTIDVIENGKIIWTGRCISFEIDINKIKSFHCEGALAFFNIVLPYKEYESTTPGEFFTNVITRYNSLADADRRFDIGRVKDDPDNEDFDASQNIWRKTDYETTWEILEDMLLDAEGGYFDLSKGRKGNNPVQIDYIEDFYVTCDQPIVFGTNLVNINKSANGSGIVTDIVPVCHYNDETYTLQGFDSGDKTENKKYKKALQSSWDVRPNSQGVMVNYRLRQYYPRVEKVVEYDMIKNLESVTSLEEKEEKKTLTADEKIELATKRASNEEIIRKTKYYMYKNSKKKAKQLERATISFSVSAADLANLRSGRDEATGRAIPAERVRHDTLRSGGTQTLSLLTIDEESPEYNFHLGDLVTVNVPALGINYKQYPITQMTLDLTSGVKEMTIGVPEKRQLTKILKPDKNTAKSSYKKDGNKHTLKNKKKTADDDVLNEIKFTETHISKPSNKDEYHVSDIIALSDYKVGLLKADGSTIDVTADCTFTIGTGQDAVSAVGYEFLDKTDKLLYAHYTRTVDILVDGKPSGQTETVDLECYTKITIADSYMTKILFVKTKTDYKIGDELDLDDFEIQGRFDDDHTTEISVHDPYIYFNMANGHKMAADDHGFEFKAYYHGPEIYGSSPLTDACTFNIVDGDAALGEADADGNQLVITDYPEYYTVKDKFYKSRYTVYLYTAKSYSYATIVTDRCIMSIGEGHEFTDDEIGNHDYCGMNVNNPNIGVYATLRVGNHNIASLPVPYTVLEKTTEGDNHNELLWFNENESAHTAAFPLLHNPQTTWRVNEQFNHAKCPVLFWYNTEATYYNVTNDTATHWNLPDDYVFTEEDIERAQNHTLFIQASRLDQTKGLATEPLYLTIIKDQATDDPYNGDRLDFNGYPQRTWVVDENFKRSTCPTHHYIDRSGYGGTWYDTTYDNSVHYMLDNMELTENYKFQLSDDGKTLSAWLNSENGTLSTEHSYTITVQAPTKETQTGYRIKFTSKREFYTEGDLFNAADYPVGQYKTSDPDNVVDVSSSGTYWNLTGHTFTKEEAQATKNGHYIEVTAHRLVENEVLEVENPAHIWVVEKVGDGEMGENDDYLRWKSDNMPSNYAVGDKIYHYNYPVLWIDKEGSVKAEITDSEAAHYTLSGNALIDGYEFTQADKGKTFYIQCGFVSNNEMLYTTKFYINIIEKGEAGEIDPIDGGIEWDGNPRTTYKIGDYFNRNECPVVQIISHAGGSSQSSSRQDITQVAKYNIRDNFRFTQANASEWAIYESEGIQASYNVGNVMRYTTKKPLTILDTTYNEWDDNTLTISAGDTSFIAGLDKFEYSNFTVIWHKKDGSTQDVTALSSTHYEMDNTPISNNYTFQTSDIGSHSVTAWINIENHAVRTETPVTIQVMKSYAPGTGDKDENTLEFTKTPTLYSGQPFSLKGFELTRWDKYGNSHIVTNAESTSYDIPLGYVLKASDDGRTLTGYYQQGNSIISAQTTLTVLESYADGGEDDDGNKLLLDYVYNPWYDGEEFDHTRYTLNWYDKYGNPTDVTNSEYTTWSIPDGEILHYGNHPSKVTATYRVGNHAISKSASIQVIKGNDPGSADEDGNVLRFTRTHGTWYGDDTFSLSGYDVTWYNKYGDGSVVTSSCTFSGIKVGYKFKGDGTDPTKLTAFFRVGNHTISCETTLTVEAKSLAMTSIEIVQPYDTTYDIGDTFYRSSLTVIGHYNDGTQVTISNSHPNLIWGGYANGSTIAAGDNLTVSVQYNGYEAQGAFLYDEITLRLHRNFDTQGRYLYLQQCYRAIGAPWPTHQSSSKRVKWYTNIKVYLCTTNGSRTDVTQQCAYSPASIKVIPGSELLAPDYIYVGYTSPDGTPLYLNEPMKIMPILGCMDAESGGAALLAQGFGSATEIWLAVPYDLFSSAKVFYNQACAQAGYEQYTDPSTHTTQYVTPFVSCSMKPNFDHTWITGTDSSTGTPLYDQLPPGFDPDGDNYDTEYIIIRFTCTF